MAEPTQLIVPPDVGENQSPEQIQQWEAVVVDREVCYKDRKNEMHPQLYESPNCITLYVGEKGISVGKRLVGNRLQHLVYFERHGLDFCVPIWQDDLRLGKPYRPLAEKLAALQALTTPRGLSNEELQWSTQGSALDQYVKALWIGIRAQRERLTALGLDEWTASRIFDGPFVKSVDKVCRLFRPQFRQAMESPGQTVSGLIESCERQTPSWPADNAGVIYIRAYTHVDDHPDINNAGLYTGWTTHAEQRDLSHKSETAKPPRITARPSHYDIARKTLSRHRHVLIALHQHDTETLAAGGTPEARRMAEQTIMLMLKSYAPWTRSSNALDIHLQRARLLQNVESRVRQETGFQSDWIVPHGTNVSSPLFEVWHAGCSPGIPAVMQCLSVLPPHPKASGKLVARAAVSFHARGARRESASCMFQGHRSGSSAPTSTITILLPHALTSKIRESVEVAPSTGVFFATIVFELMDSGEHDRPYFGLPATGPYSNFGALNALGIRIEWKHHSLSRWFTASLQLGPGRQKAATNALLTGDSTQIENLYQEAVALIQMVRGEECPAAPEGFFMSIGFRGSPPTRQCLEVDHLEQTIRWTAPLPTLVSPPPRSTEQENRHWLIAHKAEIMTIGFRYPPGHAFWAVDLASAQSASKEIRCDTCTILTRRGYVHRNDLCLYDSETGTCQTCKALNRPCTFTPLTRLLAGWVGGVEGEAFDHTEYMRSNMFRLPSYGGGPLRRLVGHLAMPVDEASKVTEIPEPVGWESLYSFLGSGEEDGTAENTMGLEDVEDDEGEDEETGM